MQASPTLFFSADGRTPANPPFVELPDVDMNIEEALRRHSEWTVSEVGSPEEIAGATIANVDFSKFNSRGLSVRDCRLVRCRFSDATAVDMVVARTSFRDCAFDGAVLASLYAHDSSFEACNFDGADLSTATLRDSTIATSYLAMCNLTKASFYGCGLRGVDLTGAAAKKTYWDGCDLRRARYTRALLSSARFVACDLRGVSFEDAQFEGTSLRSCYVHDLSGPAQLSDTVRTAVLAEDCDSSAAADGTQRASEADVVAMLKR